MSRVPRIAIVVLALVLLAAGASLAVADQRAAGRLASGLSVGGVPVGGLTQAEAVARVERTLGPASRRPLRVSVAGRRFTLTARRAGLRVDLRAAVARAYARGRAGAWPQRAWRSLRGAPVRHDEPPGVTVERGAVSAFVARIRRSVARDPVDARVELSVQDVRMEPARKGRRLARAPALTRRIGRALTEPGAGRRLRARTAAIAPAVSTRAAWRKQPTAVTVSLAERRVRVFDRGELAHSYTVAVGEPRYPTPPGRFSVQTMQVDPPWNVPQSEWAGALAGQTIPGGDPANPLVARWIGFNGAVGFHGTASAGSLGGAASHGCVRMSPPDVIDLYERVRVGTPVLVA